jgi:hypothetical protein
MSGSHANSTAGRRAEILAIILGGALGGGLLIGCSSAAAPSPTPPGSTIAAAGTPTASLATETSPAPTGTPAPTPTASASPQATPVRTPTPLPNPTPAPNPCMGNAVSTAGAPAASPAAIPAIAPGHFAAAGPLVPNVGYETATLLVGGKVLFVGGGASPGSAQLYDPATNKFSVTGSMIQARRQPVAVRLPNGKVLVAGGVSLGCAVMNVDTIELYNPATGKFASLGAPVEGSTWSSATLLLDGTVLLTGGVTPDATGDGTIDVSLVYNPTSGAFTRVGGTTQVPVDSAAVLLADHTVLFAGGAGAVDGGLGEPLDTALLYHPDTKTFVPVAHAMTHSRAQARAIRLSSGKVLIAGGAQDCVDDVCTPQPSAELYDPATGQFTATPPMTMARISCGAVLLPGDKVVFAGGGIQGLNSAAQDRSAELWSGSSFAATAGAMTHARYVATATLLLTGRVLVVGDGTADLYQP